MRVAKFDARYVRSFVRSCKRYSVSSALFDQKHVKLTIMICSRCSQSSDLARLAILFCEICCIKSALFRDFLAVLTMFIVVRTVLFLCEISSPFGTLRTPRTSDYHKIH